MGVVTEIDCGISLATRQYSNVKGNGQHAPKTYDTIDGAASAGALEYADVVGLEDLYQIVDSDGFGSAPIPASDWNAGVMVLM